MTLRSSNQRCDDGGLHGGAVKYLSWELNAEIAYRNRAGRQDYGVFHRNHDELAKWADGPHTSFPPKLSTSQACHDLSEWFALGWTVSHSPDKKSKVNIAFNGIPGRMYAVQTVIADPRENILSESMQMLSTAAGAGGGPVCYDDNGNPHPLGSSLCSGKKYCNFVDDPGMVHYYPGSHEYDDLGCYRPAPGPQGREGGAGETPGNGGFTWPSSAVTGQSTDQHLSSQSTADPAGTTLSWWTPRALQVGAYNPDNDPTNNPTSTYAENHSYTIRGGGDGFQNTGSGYPIHWGDGQGPLEHAHPGHQMWGAKVPLILGDNGSLLGDWTLAVTRATRQPASPSMDDISLSDETRAGTLIGESRFASSFDPDKDADASYSDWTSLTSDGCEGNAPYWSGPDHIPHACGNPAGEDLGQHWSVRDAYYLPAMSGDGQTSVSTLFHQAKDGTARIQAYSDDNSSFANHLARIEVWDYDSYFTPGAAPDYSIDQPSALGDADGRIDFCPTKVWVTNLPVSHHDWVDTSHWKTVPHQDYVGDVPHWFVGNGSNSWGSDGATDAINPPDPNNPFYTTHYWGGGSGKPADVAWWQNKSNAGDKRYTSVPPNNLSGAATPDGTRNWTFIGFGRSWWYTGQDAGAHALYHTWDEQVWVQEGRWHDYTTYDGSGWVDSPDCVGSAIPVNAPKDGNGFAYLPAGDYIVRYIFAAGTGWSGGHWNIHARYQENPSMAWVDHFDFQTDSHPVQVFSPRASG